MNLKKIFSLTLATLFSLPSLHASEHFKKAAVVTLVAASVLSGESKKQEKVIKNRKGETFTFHGDGTVSVKDIFDNDLGVHLTNSDNPLSHQSIELVKEGDRSAVFVGLGIKGGNEFKDWLIEIGLREEHYKNLKDYGIHSSEDLKELDSDELEEVCRDCKIKFRYKDSLIKAVKKANTGKVILGTALAVGGLFLAYKLVKFIKGSEEEDSIEDTIRKLTFVIKDQDDKAGW